jgi:hypothetical protein
VVGRIETSTARAQILVDLTTATLAALIADVLILARSLDFPIDRAKALTAVAPRLDGQ